MSIKSDTNTYIIADIFERKYKKFLSVSYQIILLLELEGSQSSCFD